MQTRVSDAAKRIADTYNLHRAADPHSSVGKWFASRLNDGTTDGTLYDSKVEAVRHQRHDEDFYCFTQIVPSTMTPENAETFLNIQRRMYDKGLRLADRDTGGKDMIRRVSQEDMRSQLRAMFRGDVAPTNITHGTN